MELTNYKISKHAEERYSQRLLNKDNMNDVNKFITENKEKIKTDLNKMVSYGECIYVGRQSQKDGKGKVLNVYLKDTWVLLVDTSNDTLVTIFKIDLGCGDEFNMQYINKMLEQINQSKENLAATQLDVTKESAMYKEMQDECKAQINEYKAIIKNLEELCSGYQYIIDNNNVKVSQANREVADIVNKLINKKEF